MRCSPTEELGWKSLQGGKARFMSALTSVSESSGFHAVCLPRALEVERRALDVNEAEEVSVKLGHLRNIAAGPAYMIESPNGKRVAGRRHTVISGLQNRPEIRTDPRRNLQFEGGCTQCNLYIVFLLCRSRTFSCTGPPCTSESTASHKRPLTRQAKAPLASAAEGPLLGSTIAHSDA